jgi:hypothetical protein
VTVTEDPDDWMAAFDALPEDPLPPRPDIEGIDELRARRQREGRQERDRPRPGDPVTNDLFQSLYPEYDEGPDEPRLLNIRWTSTYATDPPPLEDPVIQGLLNAGEFMVVGAERGIGKTWLGYNIASLLATGDGPLFGRLLIPKKRNVLYLQGELDETQAAVRWKIMHGNGLDFGDAQLPEVAESFDPVRFRVVRRRRSYKGEGETFSDEYLDATIDEQLEATIDALGIEVVVVDPWAVFLQGNENSNDEVEAVLSKLREIGMRNNVAFIIFHHLGKARDYAEPEDMWRGASRLADWAANRVTIVRHYTDKKAADLGLERRDARRYADLKFLRRGAPIDDFSVHLDPDGWWREWTPARGDDDGVGGTTDAALLNELRRQPDQTFHSTKDAARLTAFAEGTCKTHLTILASRGLVRRTKRGQADVWTLAPSLEEDK